MKVYGNLRKMSSELHDEVHYKLPFFDATNFSQEINLNALIGQTINISYGFKFEDFLRSNHRD